MMYRYICTYTINKNFQSRQNITPIMAICSVKGCDSKAYAVKLYRIGKKRSHFLKCSPWGWKNHVTKFICSKHFRENDFLNGARRIIKQNALPSLFNFNSFVMTSTDNVMHDHHHYQISSSSSILHDHSYNNCTIDDFQHMDIDCDTNSDENEGM